MTLSQSTLPRTTAGDSEPTGANRGRFPARPVRGWVEALAVALVMLVWSLGVRGYEGGRWWDVPVIRSFVDERLYRQDPFVWIMHEGTPSAYPYRLIAGVMRLLPGLPLDSALLVLYLPATLAALALLYRLGLRLTGERVVALLFVLLYVDGFRLVTVGTTILHSAETTPQTLALPFQLGALYALLGGRLALAGALMGLGFYLHTPSTVYLGGALGVYELAGWRAFGLRRVALSLGLLGLVGAPVIVGSFLRHSDQMPLWALSLARAATASDISLVAHFSTRPLIVYNLLGLAITALAVRAAPADSGRRMTLIFFVVVGAMWLGALLFVDLSLQTPFSTLAERLQLTRSAWLLNLLGLIYLTRLLVVGWRAGRLPKPLALLLVAAMLEAPPDWNHLDPLLLAGWVLLLAQQLGRRPLLDRLGTWGPWALALLGGLAGAAHLELKELDFGLSLRTTIVFGGLALGWGLYEALTRRGVDARRAAPALALGLLCAVGVRQADNWSYANAHKGGLKAAADFQDWARTKTPLDSVFLILPSEPNNQDFYRRAERALYLARDRSQWIVYFREQAFEFQRRVQAFGIDQPARYRDDLDNAYRRLTEDQVRQLARDFGVTHFVPARAGSYSFPIVYQSGGWTVYDVR